MTCSDQTVHLAPARARSRGSAAQVLLTLLSRGSAKVGAFITARRNRRAVGELAECDERMLKDIGLNRAVVEGALAAGFDQDPSALLRRPSPSYAVSDVERAARVAWLRVQG